MVNKVSETPSGWLDQRPLEGIELRPKGVALRIRNVVVGVCLVPPFKESEELRLH